MKDSVFGKIEEKYDKKIITSNLNKDGEKLYLLRHKISEEIVKGTFKHLARYTIFLQDSEKDIGWIEVNILFTKLANEAEIEYIIDEKYRNKGNITICLEEVLKDIFIDQSFDGLEIKTVYPKTEIKEVFLSINEDNLASQTVAIKSGFTKREYCYKITKENFLNRINERTKLKEKNGEDTYLFR